VWRAPPGWPTPPPGWAPPPGWIPPGEWPPPPPEWQFWVSANEAPAPEATVAFPPPPWGANTPYGVWGQPPPAPRGTNGLAIASLVLSLLWVFGLGSVLAVVFGVVARRQIRASHGTQGGNGLALAGLIVGSVGIAGLVLLIGAFAISAFQVIIPRTTTLHYGQKAELPSDAFVRAQGLASITVENLEFPVTSPTTSVPAGPGDELAIAPVRLCAPSQGFQQSIITLPFVLVFASGGTAMPYLPAKTPSVNDITGLRGNQCAVGYLTFDVPSGQVPNGVHYLLLLPNRTYVWK